MIEYINCWGEKKKKKKQLPPNPDVTQTIEFI